MDVLNWYEKQPRALTKEFLDSIRWEDVKKYPLDKRFVSVLLYMRDVESLTDIYWSVARLELQKSKFAQKLSRFVISRFWVPFGQGAKTARDANNTILTLFDGKKALNCIDKFITRRVQQLPGFVGLNTVTERIRQR